MAFLVHLVAAATELVALGSAARMVGAAAGGTGADLERPLVILVGSLVLSVASDWVAKLLRAGLRVQRAAELEQEVADRSRRAQYTGNPQTGVRWWLGDIEAVADNTPAALVVVRQVTAAVGATVGVAALDARAGLALVVAGLVVLATLARQRRVVVRVVREQRSDPLSVEAPHPVGRSDIGDRRRARGVLADAEAWSSLAVGLVVALAAGVSLRAVGDRVTAGEARAAAVVATLGAVLLLARSARVLAAAIGAAATVAEGRTELDGLLARPRLVTEHPDALPAVRLAGALTLERVTAGLVQAEPTLLGVSLDIAAGETVGVLTPAGPAASTLAALATREIDPWTGSVLFDGVDARSWTVESLRALTTAILGDPPLLPGSVMENLVSDVRGATATAALAAAEATGVDALVRELPAGYATDVADRFWRPVDRRLVAIARALVADPAIIVVGDLAEGLDPADEGRVERALDRLLAGRTALVLSHRPLALRSADLVVVLDDGRFTERMDVPELLQRLVPEASALSL